MQTFELSLLSASLTGFDRFGLTKFLKNNLWKKYTERSLCDSDWRQASSKTCSHFYIYHFYISFYAPAAHKVIEMPVLYTIA